MLAGSAQRDCFDVLLAVVLPHDADHDRHRRFERVLGPAGVPAVEDVLSSDLPRRRRLDVFHPSSIEHMFGAVQVMPSHQPRTLVSVSVADLGVANVASLTSAVTRGIVCAR